MMNNDNTITVATKLYGYIAENAHSSRFAVTLNKLYKEKGIDAMMIPMNIRPDDVAFTISQMRQSKLSGTLIGTEYQEEVYSLLDSISERAQAQGYCDCIMIVENRLIGDLIAMDALERYADHFDEEVALNSVCRYFYDLTTGEQE